MAKKIINVIKRIIMAFLLIYAYNSLGVSLGILIPLNFFTIIFVSICGLPSMLALILFSFFYIK